MRKITKNSRIELEPSEMDCLIEDKTLYLSTVREHNQYSMFGLIFADLMTLSQYWLRGTIVNDLNYPVMIYCPENIEIYSHAQYDYSFGVAVKTTNDFKIMYPDEEWNFNKYYQADGNSTYDTNIYLTVFF